jgi:hypothetical protein
VALSTEPGKKPVAERAVIVLAHHGPAMYLPLTIVGVFRQWSALVTLGNLRRIEIVDHMILTFVTFVRFQRIHISSYDFLRSVEWRRVIYPWRLDIVRFVEV